MHRYFPITLVIINAALKYSRSSLAGEGLEREGEFNEGINQPPLSLALSRWERVGLRKL